MKRPIKFRGRDIDTGEFRYAELGEVSAELNPEYLTFITDGAYTIDADSIAQLVGYDADGNEVYEGDELVNRNFQVDFFIAVLFDGVITDEGFAHDIPVEMLTLKEDTK